MLRSHAEREQLYRALAKKYDIDQGSEILTLISGALFQLQNAYQTADNFKSILNALSDSSLPRPACIRPKDKTLITTFESTRRFFSFSTRPASFTAAVKPHRNLTLKKNAELHSFLHHWLQVELGNVNVNGNPVIPQLPQGGEIKAADELFSETKEECGARLYNELAERIAARLLKALLITPENTQIRAQIAFDLADMNDNKTLQDAVLTALKKTHSRITFFALTQSLKPEIYKISPGRPNANTLMHMDTKLNLCAMNCFNELFIQELMDDKVPAKNDAYRIFLQHFKDRYKITKPDFNMADLKVIMMKHPNPRDQAWICAPVWKSVLKYILFKSTKATLSKKIGDFSLLDYMRNAFEDDSIRFGYADGIRAFFDSLQAPLSVTRDEFKAGKATEVGIDELFKAYVNYICDPDSAAELHALDILFLAEATGITLLTHTKGNRESPIEHYGNLELYTVVETGAQERKQEAAPAEQRVLRIVCGRGHWEMCAATVEQAVAHNISFAESQCGLPGCAHYAEQYLADDSIQATACGELNLSGNMGTLLHPAREEEEEARLLVEDAEQPSPEDEEKEDDAPPPPPHDGEDEDDTLDDSDPVPPPPPQPEEPPPQPASVDAANGRWQMQSIHDWMNKVSETQNTEVKFKVICTPDADSPTPETSTVKATMHQGDTNEATYTLTIQKNRVTVDVPDEAGIILMLQVFMTSKGVKNAHLIKPDQPLRLQPGQDPIEFRPTSDIAPEVASEIIKIGIKMGLKLIKAAVRQEQPPAATSSQQLPDDGAASGASSTMRPGNTAG